VHVAGLCEAAHRVTRIFFITADLEQGGLRREGPLIGRADTLLLVMAAMALLPLRCGAGDQVTVKPEALCNPRRQ
jgi:hypothetical protein